MTRTDLFLERILALLGPNWIRVNPFERSCHLQPHDNASKFRHFDRWITSWLYIPVSTCIATNQLLPRVSLVTVAMSIRALNRKVAQCTWTGPSGCLGAGYGKVGVLSKGSGGLVWGLVFLFTRHGCCALVWYVVWRVLRGG